MNKVKTTAILLGLTMGLTGNVFAAPAADASLDDRIAALEAQQKALADQIAALKKENSTLRQTTRIAKSNRTAIQGIRNDANRFQFKGFGRVAWENNSDALTYNDTNDMRRFYVDLEGKYRVNDKWSVNFQWETLERYAKYHTGEGKVGYHTGTVNAHRPAESHDDEDKGIQRIWMEGDIGKVHLDVGRRWRGMGYNFIYFGNESDGVVASTLIPGTKVTADAFYLSPTDLGYHFNFYGAGIRGQVGHGLQMDVRYGRINLGKHDSMGTNYYSPTTTYTEDDSNGSYKIGSKKYTKAVSYDPYWNTAGTNALLVSTMWNPMKNIFLLGDYVRTNRQAGAPLWTNGPEVSGTSKNTWHVRLNYRWPDLNSPGSFQLYGRWFDYPYNENDLVGVFGDKEDSFFLSGSKGWAFGFKYVPAKNIEWETAYQWAAAHTRMWKPQPGARYEHNVLRTKVDFHF